MNDEQFDRLTQSLGDRATRRGVLGILAGIAGLSLGEVAAKSHGRKKRVRAKRRNRRRRAQAAKGNNGGNNGNGNNGGNNGNGNNGGKGNNRKVAICHRTGNGSFHLIEVSENARDAHIAHGDGVPGGPVPSMNGQVFTADCRVEDAPPGPTPEIDTFCSPELSFSSTGWGGWSCPAGWTVVTGELVGADAPVAFQGPAKPGETHPDGAYPVYPHYTFNDDITPPETGWVVKNGNTPQTLQVCVVCARNAETTACSPELSFGSMGWGGWSCPAGSTRVAGELVGADAPVAFEGAAEPGATHPDGAYPVYPHYTFNDSTTPPEIGWVVKDGGTGQSLRICVACA